MNENLNNVKISGIRRFFNKVKKVDGAISLTLGEPDFKTPKEIKYGMIKAIEEDKTVYTDNFGLLELRKEISTYLNRRGINYSMEEICITVGGSEALYSSISSLINKNDKVLIPNPSYPAYENIVNILAGEVISYNLNNDFSINFNELNELLKKEDIKYNLIENCSTIAIVGVGMTGVPGIMAKIINTLSKGSIEILQTADSNMTIWCLIKSEHVKNALNLLHKAFNLGE